MSDSVGLVISGIVFIGAGVALGWNVVILLGVVMVCAGFMR